MKLTDQITDYVHAAFTGLWVQTHEPDEAERELVQHAQKKNWKIAVWDVATGIRLPGNANRSAAVPGARRSTGRSAGPSGPGGRKTGPLSSCCTTSTDF